MRETYVEKKFNRSSENIIDNANIILSEHRSEGYTLTLRQLYYRFVHRRVIENNAKEYKRIGSIINDARLAGLLDWQAIDDRTRFLRSAPVYSGLSSFVAEQARQFALDLWEGQPHYCEVWIEKDTLTGTIERPCLHYRVPFFCCNGYVSQSGLYEAGRRLKRYLDAGRRVTVFHLGDHDPTGLDISRDNEARLNVFARTWSDIRHERVALNPQQIEHFNLPSDPNSPDDAPSWELDALPPREIEALVASSIEGVLDVLKFNERWNLENAARAEFLAFWERK